MTTAYTRAELEDLETRFFAGLPRVPVKNDLLQLPMIARLACAAAPTGLLVKLFLTDSNNVTLFLNPFVAVELLDRMSIFAEEGGWKDQVAALASKGPHEVLTPKDARTANEIVSLTTASAGELVLIHFARGGGSQQMVGLDRSGATDLAVVINMAGQRFGWWDKAFTLLPTEGASNSMSDESVWTAAQQLIDQFPTDPEIEAAQRADAAYELGDMFNFDLWRRVSDAVKELQHQRPGVGEALN